MKKVLLAEDDTDMRDILGFWLEGEGYEVATVPNGWEAIKSAKKNPPDAVVLDLLMPDVDGYQACLYMKNDPQINHVPVIMFSAVFVDNDEKQLSYDAGADEFVAKTSGFNSLLEAIGRVIARPPLRRNSEMDEKVATLVRAEIEAIGSRIS